MELSIRDAFDEHRREESCLDFRATMLNINMGCHKELMAKCKRLRDYAQLISRIREYLSQKYTIEDALDQAVDDCIREDILKDILLKNKLEVFEMILTEYNEQNHIANEKKLSKEEGKTEGKAEAILDLLQEFGELSDVLREQIMSETDLEILTKWLKLAARSDSIDEFMTQMNR